MPTSPFELLSAQGPAEWKQLELRAGELEGSFRQEFSTCGEEIGARLSPKLARVNKFWFDAASDNWLSQLVAATDVSKSVYLGVTTDYSYQLANSKDGRGFYITKFDRHDHDRLLNAEFVESVSRHVFAAEYVCGAKLSSILDGSIGHLSGVKQAPTAGHRRLRLEFTRTMINDDRSVSCWAVVDPENHWSVIEYQQQRDWGTMHAEIKYQPDIKDIAYPLKIQEVNTLNDGKVVFSLTEEFGAPKPCGRAAGSYKLEHFGLAAPTD